MASRELTGLYVHIPFCSEKCHYCDFLSAPGSEAQMEAYVDLLAREARAYQARYEAATVFIGGGTPSLLPPKLLDRMLAEVVEPFLTDRTTEASMECNPESFSPEKARVMRARGIGRVSFGVQTLDPAELVKLGRRHDRARALAAYDEARAAGFADVNLDLIYGFPGHTEASWKKTVGEVAALGAEHLSAYCFILEEGTKFFHAHEAGQLEEEDGDLQADMFEIGRAMLADAGYEHYEISNFAKPGRECEHNRRYWRNESYLGLGLGAVSFLDGRRRSNARTHMGYTKQVQLAMPHEWIEEPMPAEERVRESLILGLRLLDGVIPERVTGAPIGQDEMRGILSTLGRWEKKGLLERRGERWALTARGLFLSSEVFTDLV
jgi:oxygen-independent coproporphyrinogen-3 oxidase